MIDIHKNIYIFKYSYRTQWSRIRVSYSVQSVCVCVLSAEDTGETETSYLPENKSFFVWNTQKQKHFFYKKQNKNKINMEIALQGDWMRQFCLNRKACIKGLEVGIVKTTHLKIHCTDIFPIILILKPRAGYTPWRERFVMLGAQKEDRFSLVH